MGVKSTETAYRNGAVCGLLQVVVEELLSQYFLGDMVAAADDVDAASGIAHTHALKIVVDRSDIRQHVIGGDVVYRSGFRRHVDGETAAVETE